ncbi:hypothetical protein SDC9_185857 [bioreactor metagenome]|uniref:Uncharacterized protein n=1 Tax=bioreactor metagenome TaxID=1076179 RepID=A0A645HSG9_9ZZZZ
MNVDSGGKCLLHGGIIRQVCQHAQLNLRVIRGEDQAVLIMRDKGFAQFAAHFVSNRNILQIRFGGGQSACHRQRLLKVGMDSAVFIDCIAQSLDIGRVQFGNLPVIHDLFNDGVFVDQSVQDRLIGGIPGFCFLAVRQIQLFKQNHAQLLGGRDIEFFSGSLIDLRLNPGDFPLHFPAGLIQ